MDRASLIRPAKTRIHGIMPDTSSSETIELAAFANELADQAGQVILPMFRTNIAVENKQQKNAFDPVTAADRAGEQIMRKLIEQRYPDHTIRGEEFPDRIGSGPFTWLLDPIDGTKAFIMGIPVWSTLIGLLKDGVPFIGVMDQSFVTERFVGTPGGAHVAGPLGRKSLKTRDTTCLDQAFLGTTHPGQNRASNEFRAYEALESRVKHHRYGADAYFYCLLAAGHMDIVVDSDMAAYDIAALIPIIQSAGGVVTTWDGASAADGGDILAAATPELHSAALETLAG